MNYIDQLQMPKLKLNHIVSCSSEDSVHVAKNLLNSDSNKKWKCKSAGESSVSVIIQLEKEYKICGVDIGNENSAFVEVFVGRSSTEDYQILLPTSSFMMPMEARNLCNNSRVRLFNYIDLATTSRDEKWDRIKVICTQPFNKHVQYGLAFITIHSKNCEKEEENQITLGKFLLRPESPDVLAAGSLFAKIKQQPPATNTMTLAQEIKTSITPRCNDIKIKPTSTSKAVNNEINNRNRIALFYDSDDEPINENIDKVVDKMDQEKQKLKQQKQKTPRKISNEEDKNKPEKNTPVQVTKEETCTASKSTSLILSKRNLKLTPKAAKKQKHEAQLFTDLLRGVVFTISGIINPERANIRQMALNMGAKYRSDWDNSCTHLICAFANTPKFMQVQGKGKIVTKDWIKDCHSERKLLPWRRFALERKDRAKSESKEEIEEVRNERKKERRINSNIGESEEDNKSLEKLNFNDYLSSSDTDDEIEKILAKRKAKTDVDQKENDKKKNTVSSPIYSYESVGKKERYILPQTEENHEIDEYDAETDEENLEKKTANLGEPVPKLFKTEVFYIDNVFSVPEKNKLERLIKGFNGTILSRISNIIDFVITEKNSTQSIKNKTKAKCVRPQWIYECHDVLKLVPFDNYIL